MLILDDSSTWPKHIVKQLKAKNVKSLLKNHNFMDCSARILDDFDIRSIFVDVQEYAESEGIAGYHCTKQLPDKPFTKTGLRILDYEKHHAEFLAFLSDKKLVDKKLFDCIEKALSEWRILEARDLSSREKQLWFCLTQNLVLDDGTEDFFRYYGGEAIYMPLVYEHRLKAEDATSLLEKIGEPVVVEARMSVSNLTLFKEYGLGRALVSYFAKSVNPGFYDDGLEGYATRNILPDDIIKVHPHAQFVKSLNVKS